MKFKLFGRLMKKKGGGAPAAQAARKDPHSVINELTARGLAESEIIRTLKDEGYSFKEIDDALNESVKNEVTGGGPPPMDDAYGAPPNQQFAPQQNMDGMEEQSNHDQYLDQDLTNRDHQDLDLSKKTTQFTDSTNIAPNLMGGGTGQSNVNMPEDAGAQQPQSRAEAERENVYEVVESVVNERVNSLRSEINEINAQIKGIQQIISEFKSNVQEQQDERRKELGMTHEKIKENTAKVIDMEPRVSGLERAFKDIVPNLVDSVREIKEIAAEQFGEVHSRDGSNTDKMFSEVHSKNGSNTDKMFGDEHHLKNDEAVPGNIFEEPEAGADKGQEHKKADSHKKEEPVFDESDEDERI